MNRTETISVRFELRYCARGGSALHDLVLLGPEYTTRHWTRPINLVAGNTAIQCRGAVQGKG